MGFAACSAGEHRLKRIPLCSMFQAVKSVKSKVRELTQAGINPHQAAKMAAASVSGE